MVSGRVRDAQRSSSRLRIRRAAPSKAAPGSRTPIERRVAIALAALAALFFLLPLVGLVARAPWASAWAVLRAPGTVQALWLSLLVSTGALLLSLVLGTPLAWVLARLEFPGRRLLRGLVTLPLVLPPVVAGVGLLTALGRRGVVGRFLDLAGISLSLSTLGAILAATFVAAPFLVLALEAGLASVDRDLEEAAATLGAGEARIFRTVTLPALRPALSAGAALCWTRALGEFGATITFAGNVQGRTQTMPLAVYETLQTNPEGAVLVSVLLLTLSLLLLFLLRGHLRSR